MHIHNLFTKGFTLVINLVNMKSLIFYRTFFRTICFIQASFIFFFIDQNFFCIRVNQHGNTEFMFSVAIMFFHLFSFLICSSVTTLFCDCFFIFTFFFPFLSISCFIWCVPLLSAFISSTFIKKFN